MLPTTLISTFGRLSFCALEGVGGWTSLGGGEKEGG